MLRRLGITEEDLLRAAPISMILNQSHGGMEVVLSAMRLSTAPIIVDFLERYYNFTERERNAAPLEAFALGFQTDPEMLLGSIVLALREYTTHVVKVVAMTAHPEVLKKRIIYAMEPAGERDRHALDQAVGFIPTPKSGATIINRLSITQGEQKARPEESDEQDAEDVDLDFLFPSLSETQKRLPGHVPVARRIGAGDTKRDE